MRRVVSIAVLGAAALVGTLLVPGGRASADKVADPVEVTNVPLPVTVGNFPETQRVGGTVGAVQSGAWTINVGTPKPFTGRELYTIPEGLFGVAGGGTFVAPPNAAIETISVGVFLPTGQKPAISMFVPGDNGGAVGTLWIPLQFQANFSGNDQYVGTLTNLHAPMGNTTEGRTLNFEFDRNASTGFAFAHVTVVGIPGS
jgi:hypothetical protein